MPLAEREALRGLDAAEALDRSQYQRMRSVRVGRRARRVVLRVDARRNAGVEPWAARRRVDLLETLLEGDVRVEREAALERARLRASARPGPPRLVVLPGPANAAASRETATTPGRRASQPR